MKFKELQGASLGGNTCISDLYGSGGRDTEKDILWSLLTHRYYIILSS